MSTDVLDVLVVCTANVCRSPVAAGLVARHLEEVGVVGSVRSAGTHLGPGEVDRATADVAAAAGVDLQHHRPHRLTADIVAVDGADLIVGMTRAHVRWVVAVDRSAWTRTFTLEELVRRAADLGDRDAPLARWRSEIADGRRAVDLLGADPDDDVADPYGGLVEGYCEMLHELDRLTAELAALLPVELARPR